MIIIQVCSLYFILNKRLNLRILKLTELTNKRFINPFKYDLIFPFSLEHYESKLIF